jgi:hypothetical protein
MKLLLDENVPHAFRFYLPGHDPRTVAFMGWKGVRNGDLLQLASDERFDAVITMDRTMREHLTRSEPPVAIVVLLARPIRCPT